MRQHVEPGGGTPNDFKPADLRPSRHPCNGRDQVNTDSSVQSIRCGKCRALLFRCAADAIGAEIEIKCRRCGTVNHLRPTRPAPERLERPAMETARGDETETPKTET